LEGLKRENLKSDKLFASSMLESIKINVFCFFSIFLTKVE